MKPLLVAAGLVLSFNALGTDIQICSMTTYARRDHCQMIHSSDLCGAGMTCGQQSVCLDTSYNPIPCTRLNLQPMAQPPALPTKPVPVPKPGQCTVSYTWKQGDPKEVKVVELSQTCDDEANIATLHFFGLLLGDE